jgi:hypothetical protein
MPRNMWLEFQKNEWEFEKSEHQIMKSFAELSEYRQSREWEIFKGIQRQEREEFHAGGKVEFKRVRSAVWQEIRKEFKDHWRDYYEAEKGGTSTPQELAKFKDRIVADQKIVLEPRRDAACAQLKEQRKERRDELNARQRADRAEFRWRLEAGLDNSEFFHKLAERSTRRAEVGHEFRDAARETAVRAVDPTPTPFFGKMIDSRLQPVSREPWRIDPAINRAKQRDVADIGPKKLTRGVGSFLDALFTGLTSLGSAKPEPTPGEERAEHFREAAENALKQHQQRGRDEEDATWRDRQKALYRE